MVLTVAVVVTVAVIVVVTAVTVTVGEHVSFGSWGLALSNITIARFIS